MTDHAPAPGLLAEHDARLGDEIDATRAEMFARLDELHRRWPADDTHAFTERVNAALGPELSDAQWRALAMWSQLRMAFRSVQNARNTDLLALQAAKRRLAWTGDDIELLWTAATDALDPWQETPLELPWQATRRLPHAEQRRHLPAMRHIQEVLGGRPWWSHLKRDLNLLLAGHAESPVEAATCLIAKQDAFALLMIAEYGARLGDPQVLPLLRHWTTATMARPGEPWLHKAAALLTPEVPALVHDVLSRLSAYREKTATYRADGHEWAHAIYLDDHTSSTLRGMIWTCALIDEPWVVPLLGEVALVAGTGMGGSGPNARSEKLVNAVLHVLGGRGDLAVVPPLARLQAKVKRKSILTRVAKVLDATAAGAGLGREELLDRTVPTFGLGPDGLREERLGDHVVRLSLDETATPSLTFTGPRGKPVKSAPKALKESHGPLLAAFKDALKEIRKTLPAERFRVERALMEERSWRWHDVERFFLDHPVTGVFGRRLIWEIPQGPTGLPVRSADGWALAGPHGDPVRPRPDTRVRLWHAIRARADDVRGWRDHLLEIGLRQPFKQAFREVYLLTPAEEESGLLSHRFAGHLLRYGQAKALLSERGWTGLSLGHWDGAGGSDLGTATKELSGWLAEWDMHLPWESWDDVTSYSASRCVSETIRFSRAGRQVRLTEVPGLVLSEVMRDADLAVGVSSEGLDPNGTGTYWETYNFGDLTETAEMRREVLGRLLPRLRIADRLTLDGRFLRVRGDLRTYRIHLGSGNILMDPHDAYLCIVPGGGSDAVFLPFEEDGGMLSIILSKAFLLAADTAIIDPSITRQLVMT